MYDSCAELRLSWLSTEPSPLSTRTANTLWTGLWSLYRGFVTCNCAIVDFEGKLHLYFWCQNVIFLVLFLLPFLEIINILAKKNVVGKRAKSETKDCKVEKRIDIKICFWVLVIFFIDSLLFSKIVNILTKTRYSKIAKIWKILKKRCIRLKKNWLSIHFLAL